MSNKSLLKKIAYLEFVNDQLYAEIKHVDALLKMIGFSHGLETIKLAAQEIIEENERMSKNKDRKKPKDKSNS